MANSRLVEEHNMLLQTQNGGKVIVDTTPALKLQDAKTAKEIFEEIEKGIPDSVRNNADWYQALKARMEGK